MRINLRALTRNIIIILQSGPDGLISPNALVVVDGGQSCEDVDFFHPIAHTLFPGIVRTLELIPRDPPERKRV